MVKRHDKITIPIEVINAFSMEVGEPFNTEDDSLSQIWHKVFDKYGKSGLRLTSGKDSEQVRDLFEEYFTNGLSEGACVGKAMGELSGRYKYLSRERGRLGALYLQLNPGVEKTYSRFANRFKITDQQLADVVKKIVKLPLSRMLFSGKPWLNEINGYSYLLELSDHYYFFDAIQRYLKDEVLKPVFIGDGSAILSNMLLESEMNISDATFIDLQHFLIRQFIVNFDQRAKVKRFIYAQDFDAAAFDGAGLTIINQDSFPEIPNGALKSYFSLVEQKKVKRVISYNHLDLRGHSNYRELLVRHFGEPVVRYESIVRNGYFIEIFEI